MRILLMISSMFLICAGSFAQVPSSHREPALSAVPLVRGLVTPLGLVHAGDGTGRLFVIEQQGRIRVVSNGQLRPQPFLDVSSLVSCCGERGLLGLAFHPNYEQNGFAYINYTDVAGDTVVARYQVDPAERDRLMPSSARTILRVDQPFSNHNGGHLLFGPDGYLYIGLGDGGSGGDPGNRAQNTSELLGKMLRIDVDVESAPYAIPPTNPFANSSSSRREIWAIGLRNPWRYSFDRMTGDLWIADVGQNEWEEVNFQSSGSAGRENYGWKHMEGSHCFSPATNCRTSALVFPVSEYSHEEGCSVTGGHVYRGRKYPALRGIYVYGDLCSGRIYGTKREADGTFSTGTLLESGFTITSFGEDEAGELYVVDYAGTVYALVDANGRRRRVVRREGTQ